MEYNINFVIGVQRFSFVIGVQRFSFGLFLERTRKNSILDDQVFLATISSWIVCRLQTFN
ncbi:MAG: hypothetical protein KAI83_03900 [Thiomargarita sp.]|nr:hypothetical protein [Thiomargarita sp.]